MIEIHCYGLESGGCMIEINCYDPGSVGCMIDMDIFFHRLLENANYLHIKQRERCRITQFSASVAFF